MCAGSDRGEIEGGGTLGLGHDRDLAPTPADIQISISRRRAVGDVVKLSHMANMAVKPD